MATQIASFGEDGITDRGELGDRLVERVRGSSADRDLRAAPQELARHGEPEAARSPADDDDPAVDEAHA